MRLVLLMAASGLVLTACDKSPKVDEKNATPSEVAEKVRASGVEQAMISPGLWQSKVTIEKFDMPGMPPEVAQRMKSMMAENQAHGFETCLTKEDVAKPKEDFFAGKNKECRYDHFTMGGGKIDAEMRCGKDAGSQHMRMAGTYAPESYQMQMATEVQPSEGTEHAMQMQMRVEAHRVGECRATQG